MRLQKFCLGTVSSLLEARLASHRGPPVDMEVDAPALTWMRSGTPVLSMRLATFTVLPQISYCGFWAPITPATTGPWFNPGKKCGKEGP